MNYKEKEFLSSSQTRKQTAFSPRPIDGLATCQIPRTMLNIECNHMSRFSSEEGNIRQPKLEYLLWLEAGKHEPPFPARPDPAYNSNVWRNFTRNTGFQTSKGTSAVSNSVALMYPVSIPVPSQLGNFTYSRFLHEVPKLVHDEASRRRLIKNTESDTEVFKKLRLKSECRKPLIDKSGKILPPRNYRSYSHRCLPKSGQLGIYEQPPQEEDTNTDYYVDMFGQATTKRFHKPFYMPGKLAMRSNSPRYEKILEEMSMQMSELKSTQDSPAPVHSKVFPPPLYRP